MVSLRASAGLAHCGFVGPGGRSGRLRPEGVSWTRAGLRSTFSVMSIPDFQTVMLPLLRSLETRERQSQEAVTAPATPLLHRAQRLRPSCRHAIGLLLLAAFGCSPKALGEIRWLWQLRSHARS